MATKKKLIQLSRTANILQNSRYVLFIQQAPLKGSSFKKGLGKNIRIFQYKNTIIQKFLSEKSFLGNNESINSSNKNIDFSNVFQGPNMLLAGNDLNQLPSIWKALKSIPHVFFCGAIIEKTVYNHLDLEKGIECVFNTPSQEVYSQLLDAINPASQVDGLSFALEQEIENVWSALNNPKLFTTQDVNK